MNDTRTLTRRFNTYPRTEVKWLWRPYLPSGKISVIQGDPGDGKTTLALALSALLSTGQPLPETDGEPVSGEILCKAAGILSERTVDEAKKELGVRSVRKAYGWEWSLD